MLNPSDGEEIASIRVQRGAIGVSHHHPTNTIAVAYKDGIVELYDGEEVQANPRRASPSARYRVGEGDLLGAEIADQGHILVAFENSPTARLMRLPVELDPIPGRGTLPDYLYPIWDRSVRKMGFIDHTGAVVLEPIFLACRMPVLAGYVHTSFERGGAGIVNRDREWVMAPPLGGRGRMRSSRDRAKFC